MRNEVASMEELAAMLKAKAAAAERQRAKEKTERARRYWRGEVNAYLDAAGLVRDTVILTNRKEK